MKNPETMNVICPVCGRMIASDRPPIDFTPHYHQHQQEDRPPVSFRVCSERCARQAEQDPRRYRAAADSNSVAG